MLCLEKIEECISEKNCIAGMIIVEDLFKKKQK